MNQNQEIRFKEVWTRSALGIKKVGEVFYIVGRQIRFSRQLHYHRDLNDFSVCITLEIYVLTIIDK